MALLDRVWDALAFEARWQSDRQRLEARRALERFLVWQAADRGRRFVASEHPFTVTLRIGDRDVILRGSMDRVEVDDEGLVHVVDLKTGKMQPTAAKVAEHPQLGVYQVAVREGAVADLEGLAGSTSGGAELVQLRQETKGGLAQGAVPAGRSTLDEDGTTAIDRLLAGAVDAMTLERSPRRRATRAASARSPRPAPPRTPAGR